MKSEFEINGWKFITENDESIIDFKVESSEPRSLPPSLFKLYSLSQYSVDALLNGYLYAPNPSQLNDIYDCDVRLIKYDNPEFIRELFAPDFPKKELDSLIDSDDPHLQLNTQVNFREILFRHYGIVSLTSNPNNIQMWSYYTNHKGFALQFDYSKFGFQFYGPFPLNYCKEPVQVAVSTSGMSAILYQFLTKEINWIHEEEWRLLVPSNEALVSPGFKGIHDLGGKERKFFYPLEAIEMITVGSRFISLDERTIDGDEKIMYIDMMDYERTERTAVIDFALEHNITLGYFMDRKPFIAEFMKFKAEKVGDYRYALHAID